MKHVILYKLANPKEPGQFWNQNKGDFDTQGTEFETERHARAVAINYVSTFLNGDPGDEAYPPSLVLETIHRWEQTTGERRIGRSPESDILTRFRYFHHPEGWGGGGPGTTVYETVNWLLSRDDWREWRFMIRVVDEDQEDESIGSLLAQLNVVGLFSAPFLFVKNENDALAVKMLMPIAEHVVDMRDPVPDRMRQAKAAHELEQNALYAALKANKVKLSLPGEEA